MITPSLTPIAKSVLEARYLHRDKNNEIIETPELRFERVAKYIARAEEFYGGDPDDVWPVFYTMMAKRDFMPNTPCLANAGKPDSIGQLSACFVLPVPDSMDGIMTTLHDMAMVHKSGGGTGFSFSRLRPTGDYVKSTAGVASGPVSFMSIYNYITSTVKQGGIRAGANMGVLRVDHPDILDFIDCKQNVEQIKNFNISVGITDDFMEALEKDQEYSLVNPRSGLTTGSYSAREVWNKIIKNAHTTGEPGLIFLDRVNRLDPLSHVLGEIEATNPCGEVPLRPYDACTLGSINLSNFFVIKDDTPTIDFQRLGDTVKNCIHFLDNVLDMNQYPVAEIYEVTKASRKIGLGVMGWADLLIKLGVPYTSTKALNLANEVMRFINGAAQKASEELAIERGPFPLFEDSKWNEVDFKPRRNSTVTVIAPTGTISVIAGCSSGIEPIFALQITRNQAGMTMVDLNPEFIACAKKNGFYSEDLMLQVKETGSVQGNPNVPEEFQQLFMIANEISSERHILMQAAFQKHVEDAVSKTINMHNKAPVDAVEKAYMLAWEKDCKGITVYRDGCRPEQVLSSGSTPKITASPENRKIPENGLRRGVTVTRATAYGSAHVTINEHPDDQEPFELFIELGKSGSEVKAFTEALGRTCSLMLKSSVEPRKTLAAFASQLANIGGGSEMGFGENRIVSAPDAISKAIYEYLNQNGEKQSGRTHLDICPDCKQATLAKGGGCNVCESCGYSKC